MRRLSLARIMHKFSTAATKSSALTALHSVGLLNVLKSTFAGTSVARLVRSALSSLRDKNLCINRAGYITLVVLLLGSLTLGQDFSPEEIVSRITANLMCTCGCPHIIHQCGNECSVAPQLEKEITELVISGRTEEEVYAIFEASYGMRVLAVPRAEGFNLLAWVMPFVGLLAGAVFIFMVINRLKPDDSNQKAEQALPEVSERYRKLIDRELER